MTTPAGLRVYELATRFATPALRSWLASRARAGREDPARLGERWGRATVARPSGRLLWLHGVSVGESLALLSLAERARETRPEVTILATTGTRTAAETMARRLPPGAIHQYAPLDTPAAARAFVEHWRPDLGVFVESEIWPNLLRAAKGGGARLALLSARMSDASVRRWGRFPASARAVFGGFDLILARDDTEAGKLSRLGARVDGRIDLKFGAAALPAAEGLVETLRARWAGRPAILAASTHPGEDEIILRAFREVLETHSTAVLVIAPRHPARGEAIARQARAEGFGAARRGASEDIADATVVVADTLGELGTWYPVADVALIGGSWVEGVGGHNPLEPARLDCPIVAGPHTEGWPVYSELSQREAALIAPAEGLATAMALVFKNPDRLAAMAARARAFVGERDGLVRAGLDRTLDLLS